MPSIRKLETYIPVSLFLIVVSFNFLFTYLNINDDTYLKIFFTTNEIVNAPLLVSLALYYNVYNRNMCMYNKVSVNGLIMLNVINLLAIHTNIGELNYYTLISQIAFILVAILALILLIKKI